MVLLEGMGKMIARLGQQGRKSLMAIAIVALFVLNLNVVLAAGDDGHRPDPASVTTLSSSSASIGDYVWDDQNGDGKQGSEYDVGISGVELELWLDNDRDGQVSAGDEKTGTTTTDNDGGYLFTGLDPDDYIVKVADSNFEPGGPLYDYALTTDNNPLSVHLGGEEAFTGADFGYVAVAYPTEPTVVTLSSFMASSASRSASFRWPWLAVLTTLAAGGTLWIRRQLTS